MQTLETNSFREATRCRRAQYSGRPVELSLNGSRFFGLVRSVQEDQSCSPQRWIVTIVPTVEKAPLVGWRYCSRPEKPMCSMDRRMTRSADIRGRGKT